MKLRQARKLSKWTDNWMQYRRGSMERAQEKLYRASKRDLLRGKRNPASRDLARGNVCGYYMATPEADRQIFLGGK